MRYSVEHLLEGVEAYNARQIDLVDAELKARRAEMERLEGRAAEEADKFADVLAGLAHSLRHQENPFPHGATRDITRQTTAELERARSRDLPSSYEIEGAWEIVRRQEERLAEVTAGPDEYEKNVAQFLSALREGGETHVTASGFKLAGFQATSLTMYLRARTESRQGAEPDA